MANRKDRRKMMKQQGLSEMPRVKTYNVSEDQIQQIAQREMEEQIKKVKQEAINWTANCMTAVFVIAMKYKAGFGPKRMSRVLEEVNLQFDLMTEGNITEEEIIKCAEDCGIRITNKEGKK